MQMMRGTSCWPLVNLEERPMKLFGGAIGKRPHFGIVEYKTPGGEKAATTPDVPQLTGPTEMLAETPVQPNESPAAQTAEAPLQPSVRPAATSREKLAALLNKPDSVQANSGAKPAQPKAKPAVKPTLAAMGDVKPVTSKEIMDDDIGW